MRIRELALALPLVVGIAACKTSSTQGGSGSTASAEPQRAEGQGTAGQPQADQQTRGAAGPTASGTATGDVYGGTGSSAAVKGHADDKVVRGKISEVSAKTVTITTEEGSDKTLHVVSETMVQVDGQDAHNSDLQEGQPVRASYSDVDGRDVAVEIHAGKDLSGSDRTW